MTDGAVDAVQVDTSRWDPDQYLRYADQRSRPAIELLARVTVAEPRLIFDLGCGPGNVTQLIAQRWPQARVTGIDNSRDMLRQASADHPGLDWIEADAATWRPAQPADLIYSNAALHWVGDHGHLFPRLMRLLAPGGCLAVQMPLSHDLPSHRLMRDTLADGGQDGQPLGSDDLRQAAARTPVAGTDDYFDMLAPHADLIDIWETEYLQVLTGEDPVLEWVKGTGLRPILNSLDDNEKAQFLAVYRNRLQQAYPMRADGSTLYPFRRLFMVAKRQRSD